jgi:hypothetical protein
MFDGSIAHGSCEHLVKTVQLALESKFRLHFLVQKVKNVLYKVYHIGCAAINCGGCYFAGQNMFMFEGVNIKFISPNHIDVQETHD